jgi:hypothetical protein
MSLCICSVCSSGFELADPPSKESLSTLY